MSRQQLEISFRRLTNIWTQFKNGSNYQIQNARKINNESYSFDVKKDVIESLIISCDYCRSDQKKNFDIVHATRNWIDTGTITNGTKFGRTPNWTPKSLQKIPPTRKRVGIRILNFSLFFIFCRRTSPKRWYFRLSWKNYMRRMSFSKFQTEPRNPNFTHLKTLFQYSLRWPSSRFPRKGAAYIQLLKAVWPQLMSYWLVPGC